MTKLSTTEIACPNCNFIQNVEIYDSINVTLNPEYKEQLLSGQLSILKCTSCGCETKIEYPLLYHDMDKKFMIWLNSPDNLKDAQLQQHPLLSKMLDQFYKLRIVTTRNELVEKIFIFDEGLCDKMIEFMKIFIRGSLLDDDDPLDCDMFFEGCITNEKDETQIAFVMLKPDYQKSFSVPFDMYKLIEDEMGSKVQDSKEEAVKWLRIDKNYSIKYFKTI